MRASNCIPVLAVANTVGAAQYNLNGPLISAKQPFPDAFVSYSIEFSSFPDFAGTSQLPSPLLYTNLHLWFSLT